MSDIPDHIPPEDDPSAGAPPPPRNALSTRVDNPFGAPAAASSGALATQSREVAETQTKYLMAQRFPRDERKAMDKILNSFTRTALAEKSQYAYARGGTDIVGPSIHAAQAIAQSWGNIEFGWRELSRGIGADGKPFSEVEAFAIDLESRVPARISFIVVHWRDTKSGGYKLKDERDVYELCSNMAQRRKRACILQVMPADVIDSAMNQAEVTLKATADTSPAGIAKMLDKFKPFGITKEHIEKRIQRRIESITAAQMVNLRTVYASLADDMSEPKDWFDMTIQATPPAGGANPETGEVPPPPPPPPPASAADKAKAALRGKQGAATPPPPPTMPTFDYSAALRRIENAKDLDTLDADADAYRSLPDDENRAALLEAYQKRREALGGI